MPEAARKRSPVAFWAAVAAVLALLPVGWLVFLREPPRVALAAGRDAASLAPAGPDASPGQAELALSQVTGVVQMRRGGGEYVPAQLGTVLKAEDGLRTLDGSARLVARGAYDVKVEPGTEVEVQQLAERLARLKLGLGMVVATVEGGSGGRLEVAARGSDAVASSQDGTFAVSSNGAGTVAVGAREGEVELRAAGKAVVLRQGQQSVALPGAAPTAPAAIPPSLFLKIEWPSEKETNQRQLAVAGRTSPGAVVLFAGEPVPVQPDGRFKTTVRLREGRNALAVEAQDVGGHLAEGRREVSVDTTAPDSEISTQKLWNKP